MAAIKRIAFIRSKAATKCLNCNNRLVSSITLFKRGEIYKCENCETKHTVRFSRDRAKVILTDLKKVYLFSEDKDGGRS